MNESIQETLATNEDDGGFAAGARLMANEPQLVYRAMREAMPAVHFVGTPIGNVGLVCHRPDVETALRRAEVFATTEAIDLGNVRPLIPLGIGPPEHRSYRRILDPLFSAKAMAEREAPITTLANELIDRFEGDGAVDFGSGFSIPLPSQVFLTLMGLPLEELGELLEMKDGIIRPEFVTGTAEGDPVATSHRRATAERIYAYFEVAFDERQRQPRQDLLSQLLETRVEGRQLSRAELLDIGFLFLIAGLDTVTAALDCAMRFLAEHPGHRRQICADPTLIPNAVEELLRYESPVAAVPRKATRDAELSGCPVRAGDTVSLMIGSANGDDAERDDVDQVKFDRSSNRHLAFGGGIHRCLGSHLARQEMRIALREWHRRIPDYHIEPGFVIEHMVGIRSINGLRLVLSEEPR